MVHSYISINIENNELNSVLEHNNKSDNKLFDNIVESSVNLRIHQNAFTSLLKVLKQHICSKTTLPNDYRTLLKSGSCKVVGIQQVINLVFIITFGLAKGITRYYYYIILLCGFLML